MRKIFTILVLFLAFFFARNANAQCIVSIPDTNFKAALLAIPGLDANSDGLIQCSEATALTGTINVSNKSIHNLTGIAAFTNITTLECDSNSLTSLDVHLNTALTYLDCSHNSLTSLDVSTNTALITLYCYNNSLTSLDVSTNTALTSLFCMYNYSLKNLDVSHNLALSDLRCYYDSLSSLDVHLNTSLGILDCFNNSLTSLDVHLNTALNFLRFSNNSLTSLDVTHNTSLTDLSCDGNHLSSLNVSNNTALTLLFCHGNLLTSLDVTHNTALKYLYCFNNSLSSLDITHNTALQWLNCRSNSLTNLDVSVNTAITYLICNNNSLTSLNVKNGNNTNIITNGYFNATNNAGLSCIQVDNFAYCNSHTPWSNVINGSEKYSTDCSCIVSIPDSNFKAALLAIPGLDANSDGLIQCSEATALTGTLNVSNKSIHNLTGIAAFTNITTLECDSNSLTSLDVHLNTALTYLSCSLNSLTSLNVSTNTALITLYCYNNSLTSLDVSHNTALRTLLCMYNYSLKSLDVTHNTVLYDLRCYYDSLTSLDVTHNTALSILDCFNNSLTSLDIHLNTALTFLRFNNNSLTSLDVHLNTALTDLQCSYNSLTSLDVSHNTSLTYLNCQNNSIPSLDVSANTALIYLYCGQNSLTSLDVATNTALVDLLCSSNSLTSLDVSHNTSLTYFGCSSNLLTSLNVKNGNNTNIITNGYFNATNNAGLQCVLVDNFVYCNLHTPWSNGINGSERYSTDCSCIVTIPDANFKAALLAIPGLDANSDGLIQCTEASAYTGTLNVSNKSIHNLTGIEAFTNINSLDCSHNSLTSLDVHLNTALTNLNCSYNSLTSLIVSTNTALTYLDCSNNSLTSLDVSHNTALHDLWCDNNLLTSLDVHLNTALTTLFCSYNYSLKSLDVSHNTAIYDLRCSYDSLTSLDVTHNTALTNLNCFNNSITSFDVHLNTALTFLRFSNNSLTSLDVSHNTSLTDLICDGNHLSSLNVSANTALTSLFCGDNSLTSLNVSANTALTNLHCDNNSLTSLDVHLNTALTDLSCSNNSLTSLDVHLNTALTRLTCNDNSLTSLNVKNGNNTNITYYSASHNAGLSCIQVDNAAWSTTHLTNKDAGASYSTDCSCGIPPAISNQSTATQTQCINGTFTPITVTATGTNLVYQWYKNTTADTTAGDTVGTNSNSYTPSTATSDTLYYYCIVSGACGTPQTSAVSGAFIVNTATTNINSQSTATQTQCTFTPITVTATGTNLTYQWYSNTTAINSGGTSLGSANGAQTYSYTPSAATSGTLYFYCIVTGACWTQQTSAISGAFTFALPTISGSATVCQNSTGNVYTTESGMTGYTWNVTGGTITSGSTTNSITVTWTTSGARSLNVNYTNSNNCTATTATVKNVTVTASTMPTLTGPTSACVHSTGNIYSATATTSYSAIGGTITSAVKTKTGYTLYITWNTSGAESVSATYTAGGCSSTKVFNVTVNPLPVPTISGPSAACINSTGNSYSTESGMTNYTWSVSGGTITSGSTTNSILVTWNTTGAQTVSVNYNNVNACRATTATVKNITVNPYSIGGSIGGGATVCYGTNSTLLTLTGYTGSIVKWQYSTDNWSSFNDITNTSNTYTATNLTATTQYRAVVGNGVCSAANSSTTTITVNPLPVAGDITGGNTVCIGSALQLTSNATGTPTLNYVWQSSNTSTATVDNNGLVTSLAAGSTNITYTVTDGSTTACSATSAIFNVTVNPLPVPTITGSAFGCINTIGNVYTTVSGMSNYIWNVTGGTITDGNTTNSITITWDTLGAQTVSVNYNNVNACRATSATVKNITVNPYSIGGSIGGGASVCYGTNSTLLTLTGYTGSIVKWQYSTDNWSSSNDISNTLNTYTATNLTATTQYRAVVGNGVCSTANSSTTTITVNPLPRPTLYATGSTTFCQGDSAILNVSGNALQFGSNSSVEINDDANLRFTDAQSYTVMAWVYILNNTNTWRGIVTKSRDQGTQYGIWLDVDNHWVYGAGANINIISTNPATTGWHHIAIVQTGSYNRELFVDGVSNETAAVENSMGTGKLRFGQSYDSFEEFDEGILDEVSIFNTNLSSTTINNWKNTSITNTHPNYANLVGYWKLDEGTGSATTADASGHAYTGTLINSPAWVATSAPVNQYSSYLWSPGGATTSTLNVVTSGIYSVSVTDANGCSNSTSGTTVTVNPLPLPIISGSASVCINSTGNIYTTESSMTGYSWSIFGGTITSGADTNSITVTWNTEGAQSVSVNYTNGNSCSATSATVYNVTVNPLPVPIISGSAIACINSTGNVYTTESSMTGYSWNVTGGTITSVSNSNSITVTWTSLGAQTISVNYMNSNSCTAVSVTEKNITVNQLPLPTISGSSDLCNHTTGNVYTTESGKLSYVWTVPGGTITDGTGTNAITVTWNNDGAQTVSVNYANTYGCTAASATVYNVTVKAAPSPVITGSPDNFYDVPKLATYQYSIPLVTGDLYSWSAPGLKGYCSANTLNCVNIQFVDPCGSYGQWTINVTETNPSTGCSATATKQIYITP